MMRRVSLYCRRVFGVLRYPTITILGLDEDCCFEKVRWTGTNGWYSEHVVSGIHIAHNSSPAVTKHLITSVNDFFSCRSRKGRELRLDNFYNRLCFCTIFAWDFRLVLPLLHLLLIHIQTLTNATNAMITNISSSLRRFCQSQSFGTIHRIHFFDTSLLALTGLL